jgi:hypothetical protein
MPALMQPVALAGIASALALLVGAWLPVHAGLAARLVVHGHAGRRRGCIVL